MRYFLPLIVCVVFIGGCFSQHSVQVAPIQVQPIRVTMDVNVNVQDTRPPDRAETVREDRDIDVSEEEAAERRAAREPTRTRHGG